MSASMLNVNARGPYNRSLELPFTGKSHITGAAYN